MDLSYLLISVAPVCPQEPPRWRQPPQHAVSIKATHRSQMQEGLQMLSEGLNVPLLYKSDINQRLEAVFYAMVGYNTVLQLYSWANIWKSSLNELI